MSSDNPPYPYYNGIPFNPSFFTSTTDTGSGLTETAANALYLRKTVTDTATALETFNEGIVTPSISSTGALIIATEASAGTVNIGSGENILSIEGSITSINESGAQQTNIGTNVVGSSTNINSRAIAIANGTNFQGTVNIMNGGTSTGTINIGKATTFPAPTNTTTNIQGETNINVTGTTSTTIGNTTGGTISLSSNNITIGNSTTSTTMNATNIKQSMSLSGGFIIEKVVGNTTSVSSMSTTFNRKSTSSLSAISCYTIASGAIDQFTAQYFELIVSGANNNRGSYAYRCFFGIDKRGSANPVPTTVTTVLYQGSNGAAPTVSFTTTQTTATLNVMTVTGSSSSDQNFVTTLITYPTLSIRGVISPPPLEDFIITAI